jgi:hypothetical protein
MCFTESVNLAGEIENGLLGFDLTLIVAHQYFRLTGHQVSIQFEAYALGVHLERVVAALLYYHLVTQP